MGSFFGPSFLSLYSTPNAALCDAKIAKSFLRPCQLPCGLETRNVTRILELKRIHALGTSNQGKQSMFLWLWRFHFFWLTARKLEPLFSVGMVSSGTRHRQSATWAAETMGCPRENQPKDSQTRANVFQNLMSCQHGSRDETSCTSVFHPQALWKSTPSLLDGCFCKACCLVCGKLISSWERKTV